MALAQIAEGVDTQGTEDQTKPLGTLQSGAAILSKALSSIPELAEAAQMIAVMGGEEGGAQGGGKYNGTVDFMGTPIEIKDGIGDIEGNKVYVSPNGAVVADGQGKVMGRVEDGKFVVIDQGQATQLEQSKMAERKQS